MDIIELAQQDGLNPKKVATTNGGEYHSPCPACGGKDRFIIWSMKNRYYCRQCEKTGDVIQYLRDFHGLSFQEACLKANIAPKLFQFTNIQKTTVFYPLQNKYPSSKWQEKATGFLNRCHQNLLKTSEPLNMLQKRGLSLESIKRFQLGWNPSTTWEYWQIEDPNKKNWLPEGIVIPSFRDGQLNKLKIRRSLWHLNDTFPKYVEIHGSSPSPTIYGLPNNLPAIILESELDAMLVQQEAKDLCFSVALGGSTKKPDTHLHSILSKSPLILFSLDFDQAGTMAYKWWKNHYKHLFIWVSPIEKSIGDAFQKGLDIKSWVSLGIKEYSSFKNY